MWLTVVRHDHVRASMYMYHLVFDIVTSVNKRTDMSDTDRDTYLNRSPNLLFRWLAWRECFHHKFLYWFISVLELLWNSSHLSFCCPTTIPFLPPSCSVDTSQESSTLHHIWGSLYDDAIWVAILGSRHFIPWLCEHVSMTTNDLMCVRNDGVSLIPSSALATALEPTSLTDIWHLTERRSYAIGKVWAM